MILDTIITNKRTEIVEREREFSFAELRTRARAAPFTRDFAGALTRDHVALIAEIKRASPSRGALDVSADPSRVARNYADNGAAAISVLTDAKYFGGSLDDLQSARAAVNVPVLRKDFIVDEYQIYEARVFQADAILLIARVLSDMQLCDYLALTHSLHMPALVEIHDEFDLDRALGADAQIIGINNRNLADFTVDLATTERLAPQIPCGKLVVAESGIATCAHVERVARAGVHAVLVGEALMRAKNVAAKLNELGSVRRDA